jgi:poly(3-hydroxybutyrate) depolymerase
VPTIVFHGDLDSTVHPKNGGKVVEQSIQAGAAGVAFVASQETGEATGRCFTRDIHRSTSGGIVAEQWTVHGAGHAWSGGSRRGSYTDAAGPDASEEMLRFFIQSATG